MEGLVLGRESGITGSGANVLDLVQEILLLLVQIGDFVEEDLRKQTFIGCYDFEFIIFIFETVMLFKHGATKEYIGEQIEKHVLLLFL